MLPSRYLIPNVDGILFLPFFGVGSSSELDQRIELALTKGGSLLNRLSADGDVAILQDPLGAHFSLFSRMDPPDEIKPGTSVLKD